MKMVVATTGSNRSVLRNVTIALAPSLPRCDVWGSGPITGSFVIGRLKQTRARQQLQHTRHLDKTETCEQQNPENGDTHRSPQTMKPHNWWLGITSENKNTMGANLFKWFATEQARCENCSCQQCMAAKRQTWMELICITKRTVFCFELKRFLSYAKEALVSLLRQCDRNPFSIFLGFSKESPSNFLDSGMSSSPWQNRPKSDDCLSWSTNLLLGQLGLQPAPICEQTHQIARCFTNLACRNWNTKTCTASSPRSVFALVWVCPWIDIQLGKKRQPNPQKREPVPIQDSSLYGFYLSNNFRKPRGDYKLLSWTPQQVIPSLPKHVIYFSVGISHTARGDQHFLEQL